MDEDIDIVFFDHDPFNLEFERDGRKGLEVHVHLPLQFVMMIDRQQHRTESGLIFLLIGDSQGFQRLIDPEESFVLCGVSDGLRRTPNHHHSQHQEPHDR